MNLSSKHQTPNLHPVKQFCMRSMTSVIRRGYENQTGNKVSCAEQGEQIQNLKLKGFKFGVFAI
jgi:hypothetical protein